MIGQDFEITASFVPRTRMEAILLAQAWGTTLSHNNTMLMAEADTDNHAQTLMTIIQADCAEAQRLVALATVLPDEVDMDALKIEPMILSAWIRVALARIEDNSDAEADEAIICGLLRGLGVKHTQHNRKGN